MMMALVLLLFPAIWAFSRKGSDLALVEQAVSQAPDFESFISAEIKGEIPTSLPFKLVCKLDAGAELSSGEFKMKLNVVAQFNVLGVFKASVGLRGMVDAKVTGMASSIKGVTTRATEIATDIVSRISILPEYLTSVFVSLADKESEPNPFNSMEEMIDFVTALQAPIDVTCRECDVRYRHSQVIKFLYDQYKQEVETHLAAFAQKKSPTKEDVFDLLYLAYQTLPSKYFYGKNLEQSCSKFPPSIPRFRGVDETERFFPRLFCYLSSFGSVLEAKAKDLAPTLSKQQRRDLYAFLDIADEVQQQDSKDDITINPNLYTRKRRNGIAGTVIGSGDGRQVVASVAITELMPSGTDRKTTLWHEVRNEWENYKLTSPATILGFFRSAFSSQNFEKKMIFDGDHPGTAWISLKDKLTNISTKLQAMAKDPKEARTQVDWEATLLVVVGASIELPDMAGKGGVEIALGRKYGGRRGISSSTEHKWAFIGSGTFDGGRLGFSPELEVAMTYNKDGEIEAEIEFTAEFGISKKIFSNTDEILKLMIFAKTEISAFAENQWSFSLDKGHLLSVGGFFIGQVFKVFEQLALDDVAQGTEYTLQIQLKWSNQGGWHREKLSMSPVEKKKVDFLSFIPGLSIEYKSGLRTFYEEDRWYLKKSPDVTLFNSDNSIRCKICTDLVAQVLVGNKLKAKGFFGTIFEKSERKLNCDNMVEERKDKLMGDDEFRGLCEGVYSELTGVMKLLAAHTSKERPEGDVNKLEFYSKQFLTEESKRARYLQRCTGEDVSSDAKAIAHCHDKTCQGCAFSYATGCMPFDIEGSKTLLPSVPCSQCMNRTSAQCAPQARAFKFCRDFAISCGTQVAESIAESVAEAETIDLPVTRPRSTGLQEPRSRAKAMKAGAGAGAKGPIGKHHRHHKRRHHQRHHRRHHQK